MFSFFANLFRLVGFLRNKCGIWTYMNMELVCPYLSPMIEIYLYLIGGGKVLPCRQYFSSVFRKPGHISVINVWRRCHAFFQKDLTRTEIHVLYYM